ncbi:MAG: putative peptidase [bacterium ADurb.Bin363]|nr:MAG: putative peptidase [bacterium ADurb.Bin363]
MDRIAQIEGRIQQIQSQFDPSSRKKEGPSFQDMLTQAQTSLRIDSVGQTSMGSPVMMPGMASGVSPTGYVNPCPAGKLSPYKGDDGLDIHAPRGTEVYAAKDGVIVYNDPSGHSCWEGPGNDAGAIRIRHADGTETWYAHLSGREEYLKPGMPVKAGQLIGKVGTANNVPHLHMSVFYSSGGDEGGFMDPFELAKVIEQSPGSGSFAQSPPPVPYPQIYGINPSIPQPSLFNQVGNNPMNINNMMDMQMKQMLSAITGDDEKDSGV